MGILECASIASASRGYDYYREQKVICFSETAAGVYSARVAGSSGRAYSVELHADHPRKSKCSCPHADGRRIICKHIVATYFTVFPDQAERFYTEAIVAQEEAEKREEALYDRVSEHVLHMKKAELQQALLQLLFDGPEWQYDRFVRENELDDW